MYLESLKIKTALISLLCFAPLLANSWGFFAHYQINRMAVFTLPPQLFGFYKTHIDYVTDHAADADKRRYVLPEEACRHYLDADHYECCVPIDTIPHAWPDAVEKYSEDTLKEYGIVPWHVQHMKHRLTEAFRKKDVNAILRLSADLGHYVADMHVPLHATVNYNGQLSGQEGIHGLWESRLPELFSHDYDFFTGRAKYIEDLRSQCWMAFEGSFGAKDSVLQLEKEVSELVGEQQKYVFEQRGTQTVKTYSRSFSRAYHDALNGMVERRMRASILFVGSIWLSAWIDAGQPLLESQSFPEPNEEELKELISIEQAYLKGKIIGREESH
jgi:hypothetical protein